MADTLVKIDLRKMDGIRRALGPGSPAMRPFFKKAAVRYLTFARRRFDTLSRGGQVNGERWEGLAESTKKRRRKARKGFKGPRKFATLVDTGLLKRALLAGSPGNLIEPTREGVRVGIGGGAKHEGKGLTIGRLAEIHHGGEGNAPARPVITDKLDAATARGMANDLAAVVRTITKGGRP